MGDRSVLNAYDLGEEVPLAPLSNRKGQVPAAVWERLRRAKEAARRLLQEDLLEMRLFGSYARGQFDEESDVDVLVVVRDIDWRGRRRLVDAFVAASGEGIVLAPLIVTRQELDELRAREHILALDLDREGIAL